MSMKLRETLRAVKAINDGRPHDAHGYEINDIIEEALAEPPLNCDVGTAEEQAERYNKFCGSYKLSHGNCFGCPALRMQGKCEFAWAQMPCESQPTKINKE